MLFFFILLSLIPVSAIMYFLFRADHMDSDHQWLIFKTFFWGMMGVPVVLAINKLLETYTGIDLNIFVSSAAADIYQFEGNILAMLKDLFAGGVLAKVLLGVSIMAFIEEYTKHLVVKEVDWNKKSFNRIIDGVEFSIAAALGFSFIENIVYFYMIIGEFVDYRVVLPALILRAVLSTAGHVMFSGIFGYYYGKAKFVGHTRKLHEKHERKTWHFHPHRALKVRFHRIAHFFQGKNIHNHIIDELHQDELIAEGLLIATFLHVLFNMALTLGVGYLVVPMLVLEYIFISHEFHSHKNFVVQAA